MPKRTPNTYEEIYTYLKEGIYPSRLIKGSKARSDWGYYIRQHYTLLPQTLSTGVVEKLAFSKKVVNFLGKIFYFLNYKGKEQLKWLWVPSLTELPTILHWAHEKIGHGGRDAMLKVLGKQYFFKNMRSHVEEFLLNCIDCEQWRPTKAIAPPMPIVAQTRSERIIYDYSYFQLPNGNARWILLFINSFTKYIWGRTYSKANATNVENFIKANFQMGQFSLWQSDNGSHFKNQKVKNTITGLGGKPINSAPYHPKCNGQIERPNGTIKRIMRLEYQRNKEATIEELLQKALDIYRNRTHSTIGMTPFTAEFREIPKETRHEAPTLTTLPVNWRNELDEIILNRLKKAAEKTINKILKNKRVIEYLPGEIVLMRPHNYQRRKKGAPMWNWRGKVIKRYRNYSYQIEWITHGPKSTDLPGSVVSRWPSRNMKRMKQHKLPSKIFGTIFHTPTKDEYFYLLSIY